MSRVFFFIVIGAFILAGGAHADHILDSGTELSAEVHHHLNEVLDSHAKLTDETIGIEFVDRDSPNTSIQNRFIGWAPTTKKPTSAALIRIHKDNLTYEIFSGTGLSGLLGTEGIEAIQKKVNDRREISSTLNSRTPLIVTALLLQIESPLPLELKGGDKVLTLENKPLSLPSSFFIFIVFWIIFIASLPVLYKMLFSEIHMSALSEKRISPFRGRFRRSNLKKDLISGGGFSGHWYS